MLDNAKTGRDRRVMGVANGRAPLDSRVPTSKNKRSKRFVLAGGIFLTLAVALLVFSFFTQEDWYDNKAQAGSYEGKTQEDIQADLNRRVEDGMMNISMSSVITFANGTAQGDARIENIEANKKDQVVTVTLDDTEEVIYKSAALAPGQYIQYITLDKNLPAGTYEATAMFDGYEIETRNKVGSAGMRVQIVVES